ncbi:MAG: type IV pilin protein [Rhodanobacteraceae bacterium]
MNIRRKRGFTLIELMIVVAIIAILAAIAVPWWGRYTYRARRTDGQKVLLHVAQAEERYFTDYNKYTDSPTDLGYPSGSITSERGYYSVALDVSGASSSAFVAIASPLSSQTGDACANLSIDNTGAKLPAPGDAAHNSNGSCW